MSGATNDEREAMAARMFKRATGRTDFADLVGESGEYVRNSYRASAEILLEDLTAAGFRRQVPTADANLPTIDTLRTEVSLLLVRVLHDAGVEWPRVDIANLMADAILDRYILSPPPASSENRH